MIYPKDLVGGERPQHVFISGAAGSASLAAPGTGLQLVPIYGWISGSAVGSANITNGTGGTNILTVKPQIGGIYEFGFFDDSTFLTNKALVLVTEAAVGVSDFHVWAVVRRVGAGQNALVP